MVAIQSLNAPRHHMLSTSNAMLIVARRSKIHAPMATYVPAVEGKPPTFVLAPGEFSREGGPTAPTVYQTHGWASVVKAISASALTSCTPPCTQIVLFEQGL